MTQPPRWRTSRCCALRRRYGCSTGRAWPTESPWWVPGRLPHLVNVLRSLAAPDRSTAWRWCQAGGWSPAIPTARPPTLLIHAWVQEKGSMMSADTACQLFGLQLHDIVQEPSTETLAVVGWGGPGCTRVVLSFRGTANLQARRLILASWLQATSGGVRTPHMRGSTAGHPGGKALLSRTNSNLLCWGILQTHCIPCSCRLHAAGLPLCSPLARYSRPELDPNSGHPCLLAECAD